jgi:hypothetical protein
MNRHSAIQVESKFPTLENKLLFWRFIAHSFLFNIWCNLSSLKSSFWEERTICHRGLPRSCWSVDIFFEMWFWKFKFEGGHHYLKKNLLRFSATLCGLERNVGFSAISAIIHFLVLEFNYLVLKSIF